jgi:chaperonin cofactor prefoldin
MNLYEIITIVLSTSLIMGAMFKFMWSRIDKRFEGVEKRFEGIDRRFEMLIEELKEIKVSIQDLNVRVSRLETQDEERFRNEIKLLVSERRKES